jgi:hypothetical protein
MARNTENSTTIVVRSIEDAAVMVVVIGASGGAEVERCVKCQSMTTDAPLDGFRRNTECLQKQKAPITGGFVFGEGQVRLCAWNELDFHIHAEAIGKTFDGFEGWTGICILNAAQICLRNTRLFGQFLLCHPRRRAGAYHLAHEAQFRFEVTVCGFDFGILVLVCDEIVERVHDFPP